MSSLAQDQALLFSLAITPSMLIVIFIASRDRYDKEPPLFLGLCFLLGVLSISPTIALELKLQQLTQALFSENSNGAFKTAFEAFIGIAAVEESFKYLAWMPLFLIRSFRRAFNEPFDGIMYSVMVAMGFATLENVMYIQNRQELQVALIRMITAVPAHATFAIFVGYFIGLAQLKKRRWVPFYHLVGLLSATLAHGIYDFFLFLQSPSVNRWGNWVTYLQVIAAVSSLTVAFQLALRAVRRHSRNSPFKPS